MARLDIFTGLIPTSTPQLRWSTAVGGEVGCRAVLAPGGRLVVGDKGKKITVLDCATGATLWSKTLSYPTYYGSPAVDSAGNVYVATWRELISYDSTGAVRWRTSFSAISQAPLQVGDQGDLYVVSAPIISGTTSALGCYNTADGSLLWSYTLPGNNAAQSAPALLGGGQAVVGSDNGDVLYINNGALSGQINVGASVRCNPLLVFDRTGLPSQLIVGACANNDASKHKLYAIDITSLPLALNWEFSPTALGSMEYMGSLTSPVISPGGVVFVGYNGHLWGVQGGQEVFRCSAANLAGPIAMDGQGNVIVSRERGDLVAVDLSGNPLWTLDKGGQGAGVAIDSSGDFYFGAKDGKVYSYGA